MMDACICGKPIINKIKLRVSLGEVTREYIICSIECVKERTNNLIKTSGEYGLDIEIEKMDIDGCKSYLCLREKANATQEGL